VNAYGGRPGVVDWGGGVLASCYRGSNVRYRGQWMAAFALQHHWLLAINCHFRDCHSALILVYHVSSAILEPDLYIYCADLWLHWHNCQYNRPIIECCTELVFQSRSCPFPQAAVPLPSRSREAQSRSHSVSVNIRPVPIPIPRSVAEHIHGFFLTRFLCCSG